jgi:hypothetical protein
MILVITRVGCLEVFASIHIEYLSPGLALKGFSDGTRRKALNTWSPRKQAVSLLEDGCA